MNEVSLIDESSVSVFPTISQGGISKSDTSLVYYAHIWTSARPSEDFVQKIPTSGTAIETMEPPLLVALNKLDVEVSVAIHDFSTDRVHLEIRKGGDRAVVHMQEGNNTDRRKLVMSDPLIGRVSITASQYFSSVSNGWLNIYDVHGGVSGKVLLKVRVLDNLMTDMGVSAINGSDGEGLVGPGKSTHSSPSKPVDTEPVAAVPLVSEIKMVDKEEGPGKAMHINPFRKAPEAKKSTSSGEASHPTRSTRTDRGLADMMADFLFGEDIQSHDHHTSASMSPPISTDSDTVPTDAGANSEAGDHWVEHSFAEILAGGHVVKKTQQQQENTVSATEGKSMNPIHNSEFDGKDDVVKKLDFQMDERKSEQVLQHSSFETHGAGVTFDSGTQCRLNVLQTEPLPTVPQGASLGATSARGKVHQNQRQEI